MFQVLLIFLKNLQSFKQFQGNLAFIAFMFFTLLLLLTQIWQKVIFQTNIFNIFPSSVSQNTVAKILQSNCISQSKKYVPIRSLWLNRVFTDLANSQEKHCLTIDCSNKNKNGPGRYRTSADNPDQQVYYFNKPHDNEFYNVFISKRIKAENFSQETYFKIEKVRGKTEKENFVAKKTLEDGTSSDRLSKIFQFQSQSRVEQEKKDMQTLMSTFYRRDRKSARARFLPGR